MFLIFVSDVANVSIPNTIYWRYKRFVNGNDIGALIL